MGRGAMRRSASRTATTGHVRFQRRHRDALPMRVVLRLRCPRSSMKTSCTSSDRSRTLGRIIEMNDRSNEMESQHTGADQALTALLDELDARSTAQPIAERRVDQRFRYRNNGLTAFIQQPGDAFPKKYHVIPRNLSEGGMCFLHGGFVHVNSKVTVQLITLHGTWHDVEGFVAGCRLVKGKIHEVGVQFHSAIQPSEYCKDAVQTRILLVDDDPFAIRLGKVFLQKLTNDIHVADNGQKAIDTALSQPFDLILMDIEMPTMDGLTATRELRSKGYTGRIVAVTARTQPEDQQKCLDAGCDDYLPKPYDQNSIASLIESANQEPLFSTLATDPDIEEVINGYVAELPKSVLQLIAAAQQEDTQALMAIARRLKGEGSMYGFDPITELAGKLESTLVADSAVKNVRGQVDDLIRLCRQVRSTSNCPTKSAVSENIE